MAAQYYHIFIIPKAGVTREQVEKEMNGASDWIRYFERCYVIQTQHDETHWKSKLTPFVDPMGHLFICKLDPSHYEGWMTKAFWEWWEPKAKSAPRL